MEEQNYEYRTGRTHPRKSRSGAVAALLILVIFFGGIISVLGLINIRLWSAGSGDQNAPVSFSSGAGNEDAYIPAQSDGSEVCASLELEGMTVQEIPPVYQNLYELPQGLYIAAVARNSHASELGISAGDILLCFGGTQVDRICELQSLADTMHSHGQVEIVIYRYGQKNHFTLTLDGDS